MGGGGVTLVNIWNFYFDITSLNYDQMIRDSVNSFNKVQALSDDISDNLKLLKSDYARLQLRSKYGVTPFTFR
jgi:hypothetical protein